MDRREALKRTALALPFCVGADVVDADSRVLILTVPVDSVLPDESRKQVKEAVHSLLKEAGFTDVRILCLMGIEAMVL